MDLDSKITRIVLLEEKIGLILEQISNLELVEFVIVDGVFTRVLDYIQVLNQKIEVLEQIKKDLVDDILEHTELEQLYQVMASLPDGRLKMMKSLTAVNLIELKNRKMEEEKVLWWKLHKGRYSFLC